MKTWFSANKKASGFALMLSHTYEPNAFLSFFSSIVREDVSSERTACSSPAEAVISSWYLVPNRVTGSTLTSVVIMFRFDP